ncbi:MAG: L-aspartate oxidase [Gammaproteobacteria bacterium]|nr:MAG: L-aspartate oxidase [Gammaproteobacteria bacterium]
MTETRYEVLIIGGGLAGMSLALRLAESGRDVGLVTKGPLTESSSNWAQGGIAAAIGPRDTTESHAADTLVAGAGLCKPEVVAQTVARGPACIQWLIDKGVEFTQAEGDGHAELHLTREGGHSERRVVHAADATGHAVMAVLEAKISAHPHIHMLLDQIVVDLITTAKLTDTGHNRCLGAYALDRNTHRINTLSAHTVVLATGGASKVYLYTSNMDTATGDGIAMAWRAGCRVANLEFVQFHPTCLYHPHAKSVLISEAVRGEGGHLLLPDGTRFMPEHDARAELAPRDIVARAIDYEMKRGGFDSVYLDISHKPAEEVLRRFPNIARNCLAFGVDITQEPIPVVPAAHYTCGGIITDLHGRTDIPGLFAIGECACTGLHGANRLASNSLLECVVFAAAAHEQILAELEQTPLQPPPLPAWDESRVTDPDEQIVVSHNWHELRRFMWDYVGIVRTNKRLERALHRVELLQGEIAEYYGNFKVTNDLIELRNLVLIAELTIRSAQMRHESRGLHYNLDYPDAFPDANATDTVLNPDWNGIGAMPVIDI